MVKKTLEKSYYYDLLEYIHDLGYNVEYILDSFLQYLSVDTLEDFLSFFIRTHDIDLNSEE
jgi:hypothetical protein